MLKQVRSHLIETARPALEALIQHITGIKLCSLHHDISTVTSEEVVIFTLAEARVSASLENRGLVAYLSFPQPRKLFSGMYSRMGSTRRIAVTLSAAVRADVRFAETY